MNELQHDNYYYKVLNSTTVIFTYFTIADVATQWSRVVTRPVVSCRSRRHATVVTLVTVSTAVAGRRRRLARLVVSAPSGRRRTAAAALLVPKTYDLLQSDVTATFWHGLWQVPGRARTRYARPVSSRRLAATTTTATTTTSFTFLWYRPPPPPAQMSFHVFMLQRCRRPKGLVVFFSFRSFFFINHKRVLRS